MVKCRLEWVAQGPSEAEGVHGRREIHPSDVAEEEEEEEKEEERQRKNLVPRRLKCVNSPAAVLFVLLRLRHLLILFHLFLRLLFLCPFGFRNRPLTSSRRADAPLARPLSANPLAAGEKKYLTR